jgi:hypothetical protein
LAKWLWGEGSEGVTEDADAARAHQAVAEAHERRLDKLEVVQQWLAEKERARERGERL